VLATQHTVHDVVGSFQHTFLDVVRLPTKSVGTAERATRSTKPVLIATLQPTDDSSESNRDKPGDASDDEWLYVLQRGGNAAVDAHNADFEAVVEAAVAAHSGHMPPASDPTDATKPSSQLEASESDASEPRFFTVAKETLRAFKECLSTRGPSAYVGRGEAQLMRAFASGSHDE